MATLNISVKTNKDHTLFKNAGQKTENMNRIIALLKGQMSGSEEGAEIYVATSATSPVAAAGTLTITYGSIAADTTTVVVAGQTLTCKDSGTAANTFVKVTDATATAVNLKNAVNANATCAKYVVATSALGVVTVTAKHKGSLSNFIPLVGGTGIVASVALLAGGTGGPEGTAVQVR